MKRPPLLLGLALLLGCPGEPALPSPVGEAAAALWTCGMHPQVVQDHPGTCPICGMDLTPMKDAGGNASGATVYVEPGIIQTIGVRTAPVERQTIFRHLRTIGEVTVAEDEVSVVNLRFAGWVERIRVDRTGDPVQKGQVLFEVYSPELVAAQEELLQARAATGTEGSLFLSARRRLENWGIAAVDIEAVLAAGTASRSLPVRAPGGGYVLSKEIVEGARVMEGMDLYRIGDLARIWVEAEVYEHDAPWVELGQPAQMELSFQQGTVLEGKVAWIYPTLDPESRTLRVRLEFENPGVKLKPGMLAIVYIEYRRKEDSLAIPSEAILHSGTRQIVFVAEGEGHFSPREIESGLVADHHMTEVLSGLSPGEEVVLSGQFLLDSESQLQEALQKLMRRRAGTEAAPAPPPAEIWACPMHPDQRAEAPGTCAECGMFLEKLAP